MDNPQVMKRLSVIAILLFLAFDVFIRMYANVDVVIFGKIQDGYNYGHPFSMILITIIPIILSKGLGRAIAVSVSYLMVINLIDNLYFNPVSFQLNDLLLLPAVLVPVAYKTIAKARIKPTDVILILILPVYLLTRNPLELEPQRYLFAIGDAAIFMLVALYAGFKLRVSHAGIAFMFFALCLGNLIDNAVLDPYHLTRNELLAACVVVLCSVLYELQQLWISSRFRNSES